MAKDYEEKAEKQEVEKILKIKTLALQIFEGNAYTRFMTLLQYNSEKASKALELCLEYFSKKRSKITDNELKNILTYLSEKKNEPKIEIKRK
jgi:DNA-binding TFAR19-related protein (PDSD5 family)